jgi:phosphatidylglycerophosphatase A
MTPDTEPASPVAAPRQKPHISFFLATWFGLGYLPKAPGTWGSLAGVAAGWLVLKLAPQLRALQPGHPEQTGLFLQDSSPVLSWYLLFWCSLLVAVLGVWSSSTVSAYVGKKDPQFVVIDEVSGQMLTLFLGLGRTTALFPGFAHLASRRVWYMDDRWFVLLAGFLFFRLFDIWKPFPIRHLEKLPGGWGIMADDWLAGIYAAILLRLALHFNLL